jgi:hypothetical protein
MESSDAIVVAHAAAAPSVPWTRRIALPAAAWGVCLSGTVMKAALGMVPVLRSGVKYRIAPAIGCQE